MADRQASLAALRRDHPVFFWGTVTLLVILLAATALVAVRIPKYQEQAQELDQRMDETEKATRDRILDARTRRAELAIALLQREMRLKALQAKGIHLAVSLEDSTLSLRHGSAVLREIPVKIGSDSVIRAPDGRTWRFVRPLGERHIVEKDVGASYQIPEWVYVSRGQPVPPAEERELEAGLGRYVMRLDDGTEIYSRPKEGPFAEGVKPASFMVEGEGALRAIFDAIQRDAPVFIY